jgi:hypothetical protein
MYLPAMGHVVTVNFVVDYVHGENDIAGDQEVLHNIGALWATLDNSQANR